MSESVFVSFVTVSFVCSVRPFQMYSNHGAQLLKDPGIFICTFRVKTSSSLTTTKLCVKLCCGETDPQVWADFLKFSQNIPKILKGEWGYGFARQTKASSQHQMQNSKTNCFEFLRLQRV